MGYFGSEGLTDGQLAEHLAGNSTAVCLKCEAATDYFDASDPSPEQVQIGENIRNGQLGEARFKQWCVKNGFYCLKSTSLPRLFRYADFDLADHCDLWIAKRVRTAQRTLKPIPLRILEKLKQLAGMAAYGTPGLPDYVVVSKTRPSRFFFVEVKSGLGRTNDIQENKIRWLKRRGIETKVWKNGSFQNDKL